MQIKQFITIITITTTTTTTTTNYYYYYYYYYQSMQMFLPFQWPKAHHVTCK